MRQDIRFALRQIARTPLFSGVVIAVIALGIGINAGMLTLLNRFVWRPAPGIQSDAALARLTPTAQRGKYNHANVGLSYPDILDLRAQGDVFKDVAGSEATNLAADFGGGPETVSAYYATDNYFKVLRVGMAAGAGFPDGIDRSAEPIAVISHSLWMTRYNGSADAIGKTIRVMNLPFTIVGVAPRYFTGLDIKHMGSNSIWIPLGARAMLETGANGNLARRDVVVLEPFARLAPGVSPSDVESRTAALVARLANDEPKLHSRLSIRAERLTGMPSRDHSREETIAAIFIVAGLIVVITCTNVSALLLGRAVARRREIGVRLALGATRLRLMRQMLTESSILALAGASIGLLLYTVTIKVAYAMVPEVVYGLEPEPATVAFAALFAVAVTFAFGLAPAFHATRADIGEVIKNSGTQSNKRSRLQATFVVVQLACSQPVLVVTSLVLADMRLGASGAGEHPPASVVTMNADLLGPKYPWSSDSVPAATLTTLGLVRQRLERIPGVQSAAITSGRERGESFTAPGSGTPATRIPQVHVSAGYFATHGMSLVRGRAIGPDDDRRGSTAVVVNEEAAKLFWPGEDPIGKPLVRRADNDGPPSTLEVIGMARAASYDEAPNTPKVFAPLSSVVYMERPAIDVRTAGDARAFVPVIRAAIREVEPLAGVINVATLAEQYAGSQREAMLGNAAAFLVGAAALVLASLGLYGIIAYAVAQRTREIGIRLAVGATSGDVVRHFFRNGLKVTAIGLAIGLPATVVGIRLVQANQLSFSLHNVLAVMLVVPVLIAIAAAATWMPARRAGSVDPLIALRSE